VQSRLDRFRLRLVDERASGQNLDQLEPSFMHTQILKEKLLELEYDDISINDLVLYCHQQYSENQIELKIIDEFACDYRSQLSIWWYTRECFTYQMLNLALHTLKADTIINIDFFIRNLYRQNGHLYRKQVDTYHGQTFTVYRGQGVSTTDFEKLLKTKGGLMPFHNFLSTSMKRDVSLRFAERTSNKWT
jgi:hypothetical protein